MGTEQGYFNKPPQSLWMATTDNTGYPKLSGDIDVEIAIVGGGITGLLTAHFLKEKGFNSAILEADRILQGTTGHTTAKITSQHGLVYSKIRDNISGEFAKQYADANETAIRMFEKIAKENNIECDMVPQSSYIYTMQEQYISKIQAEADIASKLGINAVYLEEIPLPFQVKAAVRFDNQAQFHPRKFLLSLAKILSDKGVQIFEQSRIVNIEDGSNYVLYTADGNKITAKKVVIASHYPFYNKHGGYFTRIYPERSYVVAVKAKEGYPGGMYITAEDPGRSFRSQQTDKGELILIGGEHHKTGQGEDTIEHYKTLADYSRSIFTIEDIPYRWSTQDCMTLDSLPYVGYFTSNTPYLYIATGYGKWGMTNSMASSMILSDLIAGEKNHWQDAYSPSRETIMASAKDFVVENLNVAKELIKGKLSTIPVDVDIKPGEGRIIEADGQRAGAYRDLQGTLHVVDTTCTHMGCELIWNSAENSWDCPCHGSRFSYEGDVIEGPALRPLDKHEQVNTVEKLIKDDF
ncbi:MAG TPA: FAD-dependent oxidoreductase [Ruminiclostridium sp.]|nr:FAD-dependent oxidoreductase [Ruminiclostridium sp.]